MAEEETQGHPEPAPKQEPTPEQPAGQPQPPQGIPVAELETLKARLTEKDEFIGKQSNEIGDLRNELAYLRSQVDGLSQGMSAFGQSVNQAVEQPRPEFTYDDPVSSVKRIVKPELDSFKQEWQKAEKARRDAEMTQAWYEGRASAYEKNKRLFEGIEKEVDQLMGAGVQTGAIQHAANLRSADPWMDAALIIRRRRGELDKVIQPRINPVPPPTTEVPTQAKPQTPQSPVVEVPADKDSRYFMEVMGLTEEEAKAAIEYGAEARRTGKTKVR
jgi:hypothetical protein